MLYCTVIQTVASFLPQHLWPLSPDVPFNQDVSPSHPSVPGLGFRV